jgi:hypothetical protein
MRHENEFDEKPVGFDSVNKPSVGFLLQEVVLE